MKNSKINKIYDIIVKMTHEQIEAFLNDIGEVIDESKWKLISSEIVDYDTVDGLDNQLKLASVGTSQPQRKSKQDGKGNSGTNYRVRYEYTKAKSSTDSREFCKLMISAGKVYRKEDILKMSNKSVNAGFGPRGANTYSIWLHKGGVNCHHSWIRKVFIEQTDETISTTKVRSDGFRPPANDPLVATAPINTPTKGRLK